MIRVRRLPALLAAALLLFSTQADLFAASHCDHHAVPAAAPAAPIESGDHSHHSGHDAPQEESEHSGSEHSGACTCLGMCAASPVAATISTSTQVAELQSSCDDDLPATVSTTELPGFDHSIIPFATAPPSIS